MKKYDYVCGMRFNKKDAAESSDYEGNKYYFCSSSCKRNFDKYPSNYISEKINKRHLFKKINKIKTLLRLLEIIFTLQSQIVKLHRFSKYSHTKKIKKKHYPEIFTKKLIKLGPTFVKIGQILSTRPDFIPQEYIKSLSILHENVPAVNFNSVKNIIEDTFNKKIKDIFFSFDKHPAASASLSQVHFAVLHNKKDAAVKIQRPDIRNIIFSDMNVLSIILKLLKFIFPVKVKKFNLIQVFNEFRRYTMHELDFTLEAETLEKFKKNFKDYTDVIFPEVYHKYTSVNVLTMSKVSGLRLNEVIERLDDSKKRKINRRLIEIEMKMFISDGFFHADLHPGNIFFKEDGRIVIIDVGMYGELSKSQSDRFMLYMLALSQNQVKRGFYHLIKQAKILKNADEQSYFTVFKEYVEKFYNSKIIEMSFAKVYMGIIKYGAKYGYIFPRDMLLHAKAITTAEALAFNLDPDLKYDDEIKPIIFNEYLKRICDVNYIINRSVKILPELLIHGEILPVEIQNETDAANSLSDIYTDSLILELPDLIINKISSYINSSNLMKLILNPYAKKYLIGNFGQKQADLILKNTWKIYDQMEPEIPYQKNFGARFTVHAGAAIIALNKSIKKITKINNEMNYKIIYNISWDVYKLMGKIPWFLSRSFSKDSLKRLKTATDIFRIFPFGSPSYTWKDIDSNENIIAFDCTKCPVAEYFAQHDLSELCVAAFCSLDFPLAEEWSAELERTESIAEGYDRCNFRWKVLKN